MLFVTNAALEIKILFVLLRTYRYNARSSISYIAVATIVVDGSMMVYSDGANGGGEKEKSENSKFDVVINI
jgi:hypothetical protein